MSRRSALSLCILHFLHSSRRLQEVIHREIVPELFKSAMAVCLYDSESRAVRLPLLRFKQRAQWFPVCDSLNCVAENPADRYDFYLRRQRAVGRDGVGDEYFLYRRAVYHGKRLAAQDSVRGGGIDFLCSVFHEYVRGGCERAARVYHVVNDERNFALHVPYQFHS